MLFKQINCFLNIRSTIKLDYKVINYFYVMTWERLVTNYHNNYCKEMGIIIDTEGYTQAIVFK